jgi:hypothetical protein
MIRGMICFASEQVWPNLLGFYHEQVESGGVDVLVIYHTDNKRKSA